MTPLRVLHLEQRDRQGVEVGGHRGHQRAAEAGRHRQRAGDDRVAAERDHERDADAGGDHREGGEGVADDGSEQGHSDAVGDHARELVAVGHDLGDRVGDDLAHPGSREDDAEHREELGQHPDRADLLDHAVGLRDDHAGGARSAPTPGAATGSRRRRC